MENIQLSRLAILRTRWKTTIALAIMTAASFSLGAMANQTIVQQIQSLSGNHVLVPAPELQIIASTFTINGNLSVIAGVILNVTTVGQPGQPVVTKLYQIFIQVSCLNTAGTEFTCATGAGTITLPSNGGSGRVIVPITPQVDPELVEVHDLSFIVTGSPSPIGPCMADFTITANPSSVILTETGTGNATATVTKVLTSLCNFSGTISLTAKVPVPGITVTIPSVTLTPGGTALATETITAVGVPPGSYPITNIAVTSGGLTHATTVTANVINTPPPCKPGIAITASPPVLFLNHTNVTKGTIAKTITSTCGFSGSGVLNFSSSPPGLSLGFSTLSFTVNPQTAATIIETVTVTSTTPPGKYQLLNTANSGPLSASVVVIVNVT